jgi:hypothetical protein
MRMGAAALLIVHHPGAATLSPCFFTVAALNIEPWCNIYCLFSLSLRFWRVQYMGGMNWKRPTAITGSVNHAKTSFSTEIFAGAIISMVQYLAPLRFINVL